ncbi:PRC-barrel domain-containing protein [Caballeronia sordidicola]|uniref:PRC-barrel domain-containing protein n=1 Tax=Caballeronia sordidicola TaxID=196367 RepID=UPI002795C35C|nr:PRC-barrel domain-containing protein [Caballeronia sordidicola]
MVGAPVFNESKDKIGIVDNLIVNSRDHVAYAILSVGGFLGLGTHLAAVPFSDLNIVEKQIRLSGGTKDKLKSLPEFKYAPS